MSGSLEVRNFLLQQDSLNQSLPFNGVPTQRQGDSSRVTDEQVRRARLAVAHGCLDLEDCRSLLDMLGLIPGEDGIPPVRR